MRKPLIVAVLALAVVAIGFAAYRYLPPRAGDGAAPSQRAEGQRGAGRAGSPVEVASTRKVRSSADIRAVGSLQSDEAVKVAPEIAGRIAQIQFAEGQAVEKGAVLVRLDDALAQAEVNDAEARLELAKANFERAIALARTGTGTERNRDEATAAFEIARVALELAKTKLAKHAITAPFPGTMGLRKVSVGAFVAIGTEMVSLDKIDTLKVDFKVPEVFLAQVKVGQTVEVTVDAFPNRTFAGEIYAIDPLVDVNGRALQIRARLPNTDASLRPGLFARIVIKGLHEEDVVLVPESAIVPRGGETFVYRIESGKAVAAKVRLGRRTGGNVEIIEGLLPDSTVVTAGQQRLRDGIAVDVVESASEPRG